MAIKVKPIEASAAKFSRNAGGAGAEYAANAAAAANDWQTNTIASAQNYRQAVSAGGIEQRFSNGVRKAGSTRYAAKIAAVGQGRYTEGVGGAQADWSAGFGPFQSVIAGLTLPARRPRGDAGNLARVSAVANALHARRLAMLGSGG